MLEFLGTGTGLERRALATNQGVALASLGEALPSTVVRSDEVGRGLGVDARWIERRTGVRERRYLADGETLTQLAVDAAERALDDAGTEALDLDLVLVATCTADRLLPHSSTLVAERIGAVRAGTIDIGAACMGFLSALALGAGYIESGRADTALIVGADQFSRFIDRGDRQTASILGDGAGAAVLTAAPRGRVGPVVLRADGGTAALVSMTHEVRQLHMDGPATYAHAVQRLSEVTEEAVAAAGVELADIDLFVYHQANGRILSAVGERLDLPPERVVDCIAELGNTSSASIPLALGWARAHGKLKVGSRVLLAAIGAGLIWGATVVEWGQDG
ncbi:MAG: 3-oxoacyl-[acyl-carrier-protein] synthase [Thermoleophilaceae bacterium]|nr:3-oxoacyl-[acyl-carrier-protein] synthase [Thermoleophilaceae bacterium]